MSGESAKRGLMPKPHWTSSRVRRSRFRPTNATVRPRTVDSRTRSARHLSACLETCPFLCPL
eukprot:4376968-Lingulodinium_polyedra.AAC.1